MKTKNYNKISTPVLAFLVLILFGATTIRAAPGDLDSTFGMGGTVITVLPGNNSAEKMAIQPDGKVVVTGNSNNNDDNASSFLARYNPNGTLDTSFGINGMVIIPYSPSGVYFGNGLAILPDGKILVSGIFSYFDLAVFRFNGNGSRDPSFGTNGVASASFGNGSFSSGYTLQVQPDGKIVVVGSLQYCTFCDCSDEGVDAVRFNADGSLDNAFGTDGKLRITNPANEFYAVLHLAVLPDGKLFLIGKRFATINGIFLSRINANGTLDPSFGANGILLPEIGQLSVGNVSQFALQPDGKIVFPTLSISGETTIVRLNPDGAFDASFGTNGRVVIPTSEGIFYDSIVIQPNGKILTAYATTTSITTLTRFAIIRLNADGSRDTSFGANGIVTTLPASFGNFVQDMVLQPDGKLIAGGIVRNSATADYDVGLARYLLESPRPTQFDFDGDGKSDISVFRPTDRVWYLNQSTAGFSATQFGLSTDKITPADFDGDGKTDIAVYRGGIWYLLRSTEGFTAFQFGITEDIPQPADFDGDGRAELAVYRPSNGTWYVFNLVNNNFTGVQFGILTDKPVVGDYDGDNRADYAVFRPAEGIWYLLRSTQGFTAMQFGIASDRPVVGDYDGDGRSDIAVYRPADGIWYLLKSSQGFTAFQWGISTDVPTPADFDGDGRTDAAVYRDGTWYLLQSTNGFSAVQFGLATDTPVPSAYSP